MRKIYLILSLTVLLSNCSRDSDSEDSVRAEQFSGSWKNYKDVIYDGKSGAVYSTENTPCGEVLDFKTINNYKATEYRDNNNSGICKQFSVWEGNYSYDSKTNTVILDNEEYYLKKKSSSEMELQFDDYDRNKDGIAEKYVVFYKKE